jgi:acetyl-CoA carboxylase carboxyl transferase subunit alpha
VSKPRFVMEFERPLVELEAKVAELRKLDVAADSDLAEEIDDLGSQIEQLRVETYRHLSPWDRVQISRHPERPKTEQYVAALFNDVVELRGDRHFGDDEAILSALATIEGRRVVVVGHRKGTDTKENIRRNFGSPHPEGFRKAMRALDLAEKFGLPVVSFLDTAGASPGIEDEERGQAWAIAESLAKLSALKVPVVVVGIGEGGSGGALAIGFGDRLLMLENAYYSVISPEMCAQILYRDSKQAEAASTCLRMTASDLVGLGIVDEVLPEPLGGAHCNRDAVIASVGDAVTRSLDQLASTPTDELVERRYERLRAIGEYCTLDER